MQDSQFSFKDVSRYVGWLIAGLFIFVLSCSVGLGLSFFVGNGLIVSLRNIPWYSTTLDYLLSGVTLVLGVVVAGSISAFFGGKLFQQELVAHQRQWYAMMILGTLVGYLVMLGIPLVTRTVMDKELLTLANVDLLVPAIALLGGAIAGLFQWLALRQVVRGAWLWILVVAVSWMVASLPFLYLLHIAIAIAPLD